MSAVSAADWKRGNPEGILRRLAARFTRFTFGTQQTWDGTALSAVRSKPYDTEPGLYAVITPDVDEMVQALREDEESPPGG